MVPDESNRILRLLGGSGRSGVGSQALQHFLRHPKPLSANWGLGFTRSIICTALLVASAVHLQLVSQPDAMRQHGSLDFGQLPVTGIICPRADLDGKFHICGESAANTAFKCVFWDVVTVRAGIDSKAHRALHYRTHRACPMAGCLLKFALTNELATPWPSTSNSFRARVAATYTSARSSVSAHSRALSSA